ncbi:MAG: chaperone NapD [Planctomycetes bacterium]|nr:chaperone NapD [Planctomycetota bacterium]
MTIVSALARVDIPRIAETKQRLSRLPGVEVQSTVDPGKLAVVIEGASIDATHHVLTQQVATTDGVLAVWPIYMEEEE